MYEFPNHAGGSRWTLNPPGGQTHTSSSEGGPVFYFFPRAQAGFPMACYDAGEISPHLALLLRMHPSPDMWGWGLCSLLLLLLMPLRPHPCPHMAAKAKASSFPSLAALSSFLSQEHGPACTIFHGALLSVGGGAVRFQFSADSAMVSLWLPRDRWVASSQIGL